MAIRINSLLDLFDITHGILHDNMGYCFTKCILVYKKTQWLFLLSMAYVGVTIILGSFLLRELSLDRLSVIGIVWAFFFGISLLYDFSIIIFRRSIEGWTAAVLRYLIAVSIILPIWICEKKGGNFAQMTNHFIRLGGFCNTTFLYSIFGLRHLWNWKWLVGLFCAIIYLLIGVLELP